MSRGCDTCVLTTLIEFEPRHSQFLCACRDNVKAPLLKLFEFLVSSICLFVIDDDEPPPPPQDDVFSLARPDTTGTAGLASSQSCSWWTVDVQRPEPPCKDTGAMLRTYEILCVAISVQAPQAWKIVQLSLLTLWNVCVRRRGAEAYVVEKGIAIPLLDICAQPHWPPSVRMMAAGFLASLSESAQNISQLGGLLPMISANVKLLRSEVPYYSLRPRYPQWHHSYLYHNVSGNL